MLLCKEIIGCCEVLEEKLDTKQPSSKEITTTERERRKSSRLRPVIENLCVKGEYRRSGVGIALVSACEEAVRSWPGVDGAEIFTQVDEDNNRAYNLFRKMGYQCLFADPTCTKVILSDALFVKDITITKLMMRKILDSGEEFLF